MSEEALRYFSTLIERRKKTLLQEVEKSDAFLKNLNLDSISSLSLEEQWNMLSKFALSFTGFFREWYAIASLFTVDETYVLPKGVTSRPVLFWYWFCVKPWTVEEARTDIMKTFFTPIVTFPFSTEGIKGVLHVTGYSNPGIVGPFSVNLDDLPQSMSFADLCKIPEVYKYCQEIYKHNCGTFGCMTNCTIGFSVTDKSGLWSFTSKKIGSVIPYQK